jgi:prepilin peptidase CpaA
MSAASVVLLLVLPGLAVVAAVWDAATYEIPNRVTFAVAACYPAVAWLAGIPGETIAMGLATGLGVLALTFVAFSLGWFGGGDAKLAAALACWFGPHSLMSFAVVVALLGGVLAVMLLGLRALPASRGGGGPPWLERLRDKARGVPYGIALGLAAILQYADTPVWQGLVGPA